MTAPLDLTTEAVLSLSQAARLLPPGRGSAHVHAATLTRWILQGCRAPGGRRVCLRAARVGSRWVTSREALNEFLAALTPRHGAGPLTPDPAPRTPAQRRRASTRAEAELARLGL
jgi:hypothetical protein